MAKQNTPQNAGRLRATATDVSLTAGIPVLFARNVVQNGSDVGRPRRSRRTLTAHWIIQGSSPSWIACGRLLGLAPPDQNRP